MCIISFALRSSRTHENPSCTKLKGVNWVQTKPLLQIAGSMNSNIGCFHKILIVMLQTSRKCENFCTNGSKWKANSNLKMYCCGSASKRRTSYQLANVRSVVLLGNFAEFSQTCEMSQLVPNAGHVTGGKGSTPSHRSSQPFRKKIDTICRIAYSNCNA